MDEWTMGVDECRPPSGTPPDTVHLLFSGEDDIPWTWAGEGWIAIRKCKPISPFEMGWLGWAYRGPQ